ncbi:hypothetical protein [Methyloceanibacter sp.]|uniref:hypothetical protein n=1 Tax=Methyloceanibacter sp. TaxID=1965321 RepID=UPI002D651A8A|nr:hypothetical protein [Methyloceanibacter sp.]HZP07963.1 hypothetical protein [Methyloceanibacter sp.]
MFSLITRTHVTGLSGREITDFLANCDDEAFRRWWPGTHFQLHTVRGAPGTIGSIILMDEMIGQKRVKIRCELVELVPGRKLVWQVRRPLFRLPVKLIFALNDDDTGVEVEHAIEAGYAGAAAMLDPVLRLFFPARFAADKDEHVLKELPRLKAMLRGESSLVGKPQGY